jgi:uncharacterized Tic20 family protein
MTTTNDKNTATLIHLSAFSQYLIPFGNFIFPIILWSALKDKSVYINEQGKQAINFQLSIFLYSLVLALIAIPIFIISLLKGAALSAFHHNGEYLLQQLLTGSWSNAIIIGFTAILLFIFLHIIEFFFIIYAAVKTSNGYDFKYPITIPFLKCELNKNGTATISSLQPE